MLGGIEFINVPDKDGNTMLYYALLFNHPNPDIVRALLEAGAEMELVTSQCYDSALMTLTRPSATSGRAGSPRCRPARNGAT